jgi:hypothetical protein
MHRGLQPLPPGVVCRCNISDRQVHGSDSNSHCNGRQQSNCASRICREREHCQLVMVLHADKKSIAKDRPNVCVLHDKRATILAAIKTLKNPELDEETPWKDMQSMWCILSHGGQFLLTVQE